jgi:hypothetical protein
MLYDLWYFPHRWAGPALSRKALTWDELLAEIKEIRSLLLEPPPMFATRHLP